MTNGGIAKMTEQKMFGNKYGYFTKEGKEYVITTPKTPRPWSNIISNGDYSFMVSQTGGGFSWRGNSVENRITRSNQDLVKDNWGKYIYLRDDKNKEFWSAGYKPVCKDTESYKVTHGVGYSIIEQEYSEVKSELLMFVTPKDPVEIMSLKLTNASEQDREISLFTYLEWNLGVSPDDCREFQKIFIDNQYEAGINGFIATKYMWGLVNEKGQHNNKSWEYAAFHSSSEKPISYDGDKESFIGMYNSEEHPRAMELETLEKHTGRFGDAIGALQIKVNLKPGETKQVVFTIGCGDNVDEARLLAAKYNNIDTANKAFDEVHEFWKKFLETEKIDTPDLAMNYMTNTWAKYQAISCRIWGKSSYYQVSAGYGFRDQLQDCQVFLSTVPEYAKKQILLHATKQKQDGTVLHWFTTISGLGPETKCSDDLLWLPYITINYLKETNDFSILDEVKEFLNGGEASIYEHCKRSIEKVFTRFSPRGIPLIGENDWNDGLSAVGWDWKGESFWLGEFLYTILEDFKILAGGLGDVTFAEECNEVQTFLKHTINEYGWNGEWYLQATTDTGEEIGSKDNEEGKIYLNPQIWAVISGIADKERAITCMSAVSEYLFKDYGTLLLYPAYSKVREDIGYISRYAPGLRENGGVYTHAATWAITAYTMMGDAEKAYELYQKICPVNRYKDIENYLAEPYVLPGNTDGPKSPNYGRGSWTWYTGSAQWLYNVAIRSILGIRAEYDGLLIDPCIPSDWEGFTYTRSFRNTTYNIKVDNSSHVNRGVKTIEIDEKLIKSNKLPDLNDGLVHAVTVIMG